MNPTQELLAPTAHADVRRAPARRVWSTVVWDDPINLQVYVTRVFREYFGYSSQKAERLMLQVHNRGHATVSTGMRERMEADVLAMHGYGLSATLEQVRQES